MACLLAFILKVGSTTPSVQKSVHPITSASVLAWGRGCFGCIPMAVTHIACFIAILRKVPTIGHIIAASIIVDIRAIVVAVGFSIFTNDGCGPTAKPTCLFTILFKIPSICFIFTSPIIIN